MDALSLREIDAKRREYIANLTLNELEQALSAMATEMSTGYSSKVDPFEKEIATLKKENARLKEFKYSECSIESSVIATANHKLRRNNWINRVEARSRIKR